MSFLLCYMYIDFFNTDVENLNKINFMPIIKSKFETLKDLDFKINKMYCIVYIDSIYNFKLQRYLSLRYAYLRLEIIVLC